MTNELQEAQSTLDRLQRDLRVTECEIDQIKATNWTDRQATALLNGATLEAIPNVDVIKQRVAALRTAIGRQEETIRKLTVIQQRDEANALRPQQQAILADIKQLALQIGELSNQERQLCKGTILRPLSVGLVEAMRFWKEKH